MFTYVDIIVIIDQFINNDKHIWCLLFTEYFIQISPEISIRQKNHPSFQTHAVGGKAFAAGIESTRRAQNRRWWMIHVGKTIVNHLPNHHK